MVYWPAAGGVIYSYLDSFYFVLRNIL